MSAVRSIQKKRLRNELFFMSVRCVVQRYVAAGFINWCKVHIMLHAHIARTAYESSDRDGRTPAGVDNMYVGHLKLNSIFNTTQSINADKFGAQAWHVKLSVERCVAASLRTRPGDFIIIYIYVSSFTRA